MPMVFRWKSGQLVKETNFNAPDPNNFGGNDTVANEGCLLSDGANRYRFLDVPCSLTRTFACEYLT